MDFDKGGPQQPQALQDGCASEPYEPRDTFVIFSRDIMIRGDLVDYESRARRIAEGLARANRGAKISIARVIATVCEPLPSLDWREGPEAEESRTGGVAHGLFQASDDVMIGRGPLANPPR